MFGNVVRWGVRLVIRLECAWECVWSVFGLRSPSGKRTRNALPNGVSEDPAGGALGAPKCATGMFFVFNMYFGSGFPRPGTPGTDPKHIKNTNKKKHKENVRLIFAPPRAPPAGGPSGVRLAVHLMRFGCVYQTDYIPKHTPSRLQRIPKHTPNECQTNFQMDYIPKRISNGL